MNAERERMMSLVALEPSPTRDEVKLRTVLLLGGGALAAPMVLWACAQLFGEGGLLRLGGDVTGSVHVDRPITLLLLTALGAAAVAALGGKLSLQAGKSMLGPPLPWLVAVVVMTPLMLPLWKLGVSAFFDLDLWLPWPERPGARCFAISCAVAAAPMLALTLVRRGSDPVHPRLLGAVLGACVGALSWAWVDLWCPVAFVPHVIMGHVLPVLVLMGLGASLGGRVLSLRVRDFQAKD